MAPKFRPELEGQDFISIQLLLLFFKIFFFSIFHSAMDGFTTPPIRGLLRKAIRKKDDPEEDHGPPPEIPR